MICVTIGRTRPKMMVLEHQELAKQGVELVEFRVDWISRLPDVGKLIKDRPTPIVFTCRRPEDRGRWRGSEEQRLSLLRTAIVSEVDYVDLEDDVAASIPRFGKTKRIVSHHNFEETPENLEEIHARMTVLDPDIIKIVTTANSVSDWVRVLKLVKQSDVPTVGFCMGEIGIPSRILCGRYGAPFTYAAFSKDREMAPGQIYYREMEKLYRFNRISIETDIFGVIGDPIGHSLSPVLHNSAFNECDVDAAYVPIRISSDALSESLKDLQDIGFRGFSVTIPHKEALIDIAERNDEQTTEIGAANTLVKNDSGQWVSANTDCEAALQSLRVGLGADENDSQVLRGKRVLMLGAGGVARAIAFGLIKAGAAVTITNRTYERAAELAADLECQVVPWGTRSTEIADIIVNCTSLGMHPDVESTPFPMKWMHEGNLVFDTVYNPENTLLLKQAREYGWGTVSGLEMFVRQAASQFEMFTGKKAPIDHMRELLRRWLSPVSYQLED